MPSILAAAVVVFVLIGWLGGMATLLVLTLGLYVEKGWSKWGCIAAAFVEFYIAVMVPIIVIHAARGDLWLPLQ